MMPLDAMRLAASSFLTNWLRADTITGEPQKIDLLSRARRRRESTQRRILFQSDG
jgi:hypothetical protein